MKCESGKTKSLRSKKKGGCALGELPISYAMQRLGLPAVLGKSRKQKNLPLFKSLRKGSSPCQRGEQTHAAVVERGEVAEHGVSQVFL